MLAIIICGFSELLHWVLFYHVFLFGVNHGAWFSQFVRTYYTSGRKMSFQVLKVFTSDGTTSGSCRVFNESSQHGKIMWEISILLMTRETDCDISPRLSEQQLVKDCCTEMQMAVDWKIFLELEIFSTNWGILLLQELVIPIEYILFVFLSKYELTLLSLAGLSMRIYSSFK